MVCSAPPHPRPPPGQALTLSREGRGDKSGRAKRVGAIFLRGFDPRAEQVPDLVHQFRAMLKLPCADELPVLRQSKLGAQLRQRHIGMNQPRGGLGRALRLEQAQLKGLRALLDGRSDHQALLARKLERERDKSGSVDARSAIHHRRMRRSGG